jgi:uncharacterized protein (DUF1810 family)
MPRAGSSDPFDLERFVVAQEKIYPRALAEIASGRKRSHWMWYVFPQLEGLGSSPMAQRFAIRSLEEARAYLEHAVLGARLRDCAAALLELEGRTAHDIFGSPDDWKLRSCCTLFSRASPPGSVFQSVLDRYFRGLEDERTVQALEARDLHPGSPSGRGPDR